MKKTIRRFTLVEMLTVVAIIGILAGLIIPTVIIAQNRGRETQAKTDISSIMTALKQLKSDCNRCLVRANTSDFYIGAVRCHTSSPNANSTPVSRFSCPLHDSPSPTYHHVVRIEGSAYNAMIAELSAPKNETLRDLSAANQARCVNRRRKVYLDPKNGFNSGAPYTSQEDALWRDPWGNPYVIYIGADADHQMVMPGYSIPIAAGLAVYSFGPNGTDDHGCNASLDLCRSSGNHKNHDDIASWNL
ncbi:MAG: prepilin-type N-terminal cleavage/methylation domain-containing protein [Lentisphaerae bacterium]|nr:prepilin-type N-terminal cleavage/methylation domain-containing protein [Lentisphaerota bacterium]